MPFDEPGPSVLAIDNEGESILSKHAALIWSSTESHPLKKHHEFIIYSLVSGTASFFSAKQWHGCRQLLSRVIAGLTAQLARQYSQRSSSSCFCFRLLLLLDDVCAMFSRDHRLAKQSGFNLSNKAVSIGPVTGTTPL